jgi:aryl-alcohol dehydrogenase-like predicted oxidoreductase
MEYRTLGKSGIKVSEIGYGCWPIGGGWGNQDDARDVKSLRNAFDKGVNFFDTAMGYGGGHSEEVLGKAFKDKRDQVVIATKVGPKANPEGPIEQSYPPDWIIECTEASLRRLKTDTIDVQQIHCWRDHYADDSNWYEAMLKLKEQGKIRSIGVSAEDWEWNGSVRIAESGKIDSIQAIYNVFDQQPEERLFPAVMEHDVGIIVRVPLFEGLLAGKIWPGHQFVEGDWRGKFLRRQRLEEAEPRLKALEALLDDETPSLAELALRFILAHPAVSTAIVGMTNPAHVAANCAISDGKRLSDEKLAALKKHAWDHGWVYPWCET